MITIDGSTGEGGGQVLRTALALSLATGRPFRLDNIRSGREKPGLLRQHLTAVQAAAAVGDAQVEGHTIGSRAITFVPKAVRPGDYRFAVGTAGSATLVLQTVLPPLLTASGRLDPRTRRRHAQPVGAAVRFPAASLCAGCEPPGTIRRNVSEPGRVLSGRWRVVHRHDTTESIAGPSRPAAPRRHRRAPGDGTAGEPASAHR